RGPEKLDPIDFAEVTTRCLEAVGDVRIQLERGEALTVRGDGLWLGRAVTNLLENALAHSTPESPVEVRLFTEADLAVLEVSNGGEVPRGVRERLFRRFVTTRADKGGSGLGLAIVRAVAEAHGGRVELREAGPPRVTLRLELPRTR